MNVILIIITLIHVNDMIECEFHQANTELPLILTIPLPIELQYRANIHGNIDTINVHVSEITINNMTTWGDNRIWLLDDYDSIDNIISPIVKIDVDTSTYYAFETSKGLYINTINNINAAERYLVRDLTVGKTWALRLGSTLYISNKSVENILNNEYEIIEIVMNVFSWQHGIREGSRYWWAIGLGLYKWVPTKGIEYTLIGIKQPVQVR